MVLILMVFTETVDKAVEYILAQPDGKRNFPPSQRSQLIVFP